MTFLSRININRSTSKYIIYKLLKAKDKLKSNKRKITHHIPRGINTINS